MNQRLFTFILALLIPAVVGAITIYNFFAPQRSDVRVYYKITDGFYTQPPATRCLLNILYGAQYLEDGDSGRLTVPLEAIDQIKDAVKNSSQFVSGVRNEELLTDVFSLFSNSRPRQQAYYKDVIEITVTNRGVLEEDTAKITPDSSGYYEIWNSENKGKQTFGHTDTSIPLPALRPLDTISIIYWPDQYISNDPPFTASTSKGPLPISALTVDYRDNRINVSIEPLHLWSGISLIAIALIILYIIISKTKSRTSRCT